ncbi:MAG: YabP/YqfC family sporulation protein [Lachnospiraceae bacterium]|nr:sporulation protein [Lachnospiraceae bacterium]MDE6759093.1 YabP/YqfC family sporulation protein [Lachnospiraceae bacterium]
MELPGDVIYGDVLIRLFGNREAIIENYKGLLLYTSEEVVIACKKVTLRIYGCDLHICYFSGSDMKVTGTIHKITYLSNGDICC